MAIAIILITWGVSTLIRLALSRSREFLADAGSAELTKNPDALVRALRKIEQNATLDVPSRMEAFFIENPVAERVSGLFSTHPSVSDRVEALQRYAGARRDRGPASERNGKLGLPSSGVSRGSICPHMPEQADGWHGRDKPDHDSNRSASAPPLAVQAGRALADPAHLLVRKQPAGAF